MLVTFPLLFEKTVEGLAKSLYVIFKLYPNTNRYNYRQNVNSKYIDYLLFFININFLVLKSMTSDELCDSYKKMFRILSKEEVNAYLNGLKFVTLLILDGNIWTDYFIESNLLTPEIYNMLLRYINFFEQKRLKI